MYKTHTSVKFIELLHRTINVNNLTWWNYCLWIHFRVIAKCEMWFKNDDIDWEDKRKQVWKQCKRFFNGYVVLWLLIIYHYFHALNIHININIRVSDDMTINNVTYWITPQISITIILYTVSLMLQSFIHSYKGKI